MSFFSVTARQSQSFWDRTWGPSLVPRWRAMPRVLFAGLLAFLASWPTDATASNATTAEFIRSCDVSVPSNMCLVRFQLEVRANRDWGMGTAHNICLPDDRNEPERVFYAHNRAEVRKVVTWLKLHPEFASQSQTAGIGAAASAIYPCK